MIGRRAGRAFVVLGAAAISSAAIAAPVLDKAKGKQAVVGYRAFLNKLCDSLWLTPDGKPMRPRKTPDSYESEGSPEAHGGDDRAAAKLIDVGLDDADAVELCKVGRPVATPLASGAFGEAGADEVLLEVCSCKPVIGRMTLAIMRREGRGYRFVRHVSSGTQFEAVFRHPVGGDRDAVMLCDRRGLHGIYPTTCFFFGADGDELQLIDNHGCGDVGTVRLGKIRERSDGVLLELVAEEMVRAPGRKESTGGPFCSKVSARRSHRYTIEYRLDGGRFRLVTPIPEAMIEILKRNTP